MKSTKYLNDFNSKQVKEYSNYTVMELNLRILLIFSSKVSIAIFIT